MACAGQGGCRQRRHRRLAIGGTPDQFDDPVDLADGQQSSDQNSAAPEGCAQVAPRATTNDVETECDPSVKYRQQTRLHRAPAKINGGERHRECAAQRRLAIEPAHRALGVGAFAQLHHEAHTLPAAFVARRHDFAIGVGADHVVDPAQQVGLGEIGRHVGVDQPRSFAGLLDGARRLDDHGALSGLVDPLHGGWVGDAAAGWKVRRRHRAQDIVQAAVCVARPGDGRGDHLAEAVRRDRRGHADSDARRAIDQKVGELGREHGRLLLGAVVVRHEGNDLGMEVAHQILRDRRQARLGVSHGGWRVAVRRAEVSLAVNQLFG